MIQKRLILILRIIESHSTCLSFLKRAYIYAYSVRHCHSDHAFGFDTLSVIATSSFGLGCNRWACIACTTCIACVHACVHAAIYDITKIAYGFLSHNENFRAAFIEIVRLHVALQDCCTKRQLYYIFTKSLAWNLLVSGIFIVLVAYEQKWSFNA